MDYEEFMGECTLDVESFAEHGSNPKANTRIDYMYADAGNHKKFGHAIVRGPVFEKDLKVIFKNLFDGEFFIPDQVGIPRLAPSIDSPDYDDELDHDLHGFESFSLTLDAPTSNMKIREFVGKFDAIKNESDWEFSTF